MENILIRDISAGCEIINYKSIEDVAEIISVCIQSLKQCGVEDIGVDIGHVDFYKGIDTKNKKALLKGDYVAFGKIPERGKKEVSRGHEDLENLFEQLVAKGYQKNIFINEGLVKGLYYYTGVVFEIYQKKTKKVVASGGQYDNLCGLLGIIKRLLALQFLNELIGNAHE